MLGTSQKLIFYPEYLTTAISIGRARQKGLRTAHFGDTVLLVPEKNCQKLPQIAKNHQLPNYSRGYIIIKAKNSKCKAHKFHAYQLFQSLQWPRLANNQFIFLLLKYIYLNMNILHMTFSSDLNTAIPLRCPFHGLPIVQVGFAGAKMFCAPSCFRVLDKVEICFCFCLLYTQQHCPFQGRQIWIYH